jgi:hypothetical protein
MNNQELTRINDLPCCPQLEIEPTGDVLDFRRRPVFSTSVSGLNEQTVKVAGIFHAPFTRCVRPLVFALFWFPMTEAASDELPQQVNQLQTILMEANEKIATLTSDQQKTATTISSLQTSLNISHLEIADLKNRHKQLPGTGTITQRTANGHGR